MALAPLHDVFELDGFCVSTYQAVSGAGRDGIMALMDDIDGHHDLSTKIFGHQIGFNALPKIGEIAENGYSSEEQKMLNESRKILGEWGLKVSATCVRIPTVRAHSMSILASFKKKPDLAEAKDILRKNENIRFYDGNAFPCSLDVSEESLCAVGRLRTDSFMARGLSMWVVGDQIKKGAALNALQIMLAIEAQS
jgi:aspartate-semialdehyde dehydrogenase